MRLNAIPRKSTAHKLTCLTLYRTLLKQSLRLPPDLSHPLLDLIGQRFHLDREIVSPPTIYNALQTARDALNLIHSAANADPFSLKTLTTTLTQIHQRAKQTHETLLHQHSLRGPPSPAKLTKIAHLKKTRTAFWKERIPESPPISSRPVPFEELPDQEKPRRVPYLVSAQGIPFLRYKSGPQPPSLSRALSSHYKQSFKLWERRSALIEELDHATLEDNWDVLVHRFTGIRDGEGEEEYWDDRHAEARIMPREMVVEFDGLTGAKSWTEDAMDAFEMVQERIGTITTNRAKKAEEMRQIMTGERELAAQERIEKKEKARAAWESTQVAQGKSDSAGIEQFGPAMRPASDKGRPKDENSNFQTFR